ncbi:MAG TPA: hypothetical protein VN655_14875 [Pseudolabrys sp.]|nr:hypothetical protein [Pseudolabrys sp.]
MLTASFVILLIAVLFGSLLAVLHFDGRPPPRVPWPLALLHALLALGGFALLAAALEGPPRGAAQGTASFGFAAAVLFAGAIAAGLGILVRFRLRRRSANALVGVHATLAVSAIVILAAYVLSG